MGVVRRGGSRQKNQKERRQKTRRTKKSSMTLSQRGGAEIARAGSGQARKGLLGLPWSKAKAQAAHMIAYIYIVPEDRDTDGGAHCARCG